MKTLKLSCGAEVSARNVDPPRTYIRIEVTQPHVMNGTSIDGDNFRLKGCTISVDGVDLEDVAIFFNDLADDFELSKRAEKGNLR